MSQQSQNEQQSQDARLLHHAQAEGFRSAQQQAQSAAQQPPRQGYGTMAPTAKYSDIPVIEDDDFYFLGHMDEKSPFSVTAKPAYFNDYEAACRKDQVATLQQSISQQSLSPATLHHGLVLALSAGSVNAARELLQGGAPLARRAPENILSAPRDKQIPLVDLLAEQGWKPTHDLFMQVMTMPDLLRWFLSHGCDPNYGTKPDTPYNAGGPSYECADALEAAAQAGNAEAIEILIEAGANIAYGAPLHYAAGALPPGNTLYNVQISQPEEFDISRIPAMAALVQHGADVNQKEDTPYMTPKYPIMYAVDAGAVQRARWLLEHGADPNVRGRHGSAVETAMKMGSEEMGVLFRQWDRTK